MLSPTNWHRSFASCRLQQADDILRRQATLQAASSDVDEAAVSLPVPLVALMGASSGVVAATSCFPLEVVRRRQMNGELLGLNPFAALLSVVRDEGVRVLVKGSGVNCVKVAMGNSIG